MSELRKALEKCVDALQEVNGRMIAGGPVCDPAIAQARAALAAHPEDASPTSRHSAFADAYKIAARIVASKDDRQEAIIALNNCEDECRELAAPPATPAPASTFNQFHRAWCVATEIPQYKKTVWLDAESQLKRAIEAGKDRNPLATPAPAVPEGLANVDLHNGDRRDQGYVLVEFCNHLAAGKFYEAMKSQIAAAPAAGGGE